MKRHRTDVVSLVFGLIFLSVVGWWIARRYLHLTVDLPNAGWIAASALILLGILGVLASLRRTEKTHDIDDRGDRPLTE